jgi:DNA repair ATPase RecN
MNQIIEVSDPQNWGEEAFDMKEEMQQNELLELQKNGNNNFKKNEKKHNYDEFNNQIIELENKLINTESENITLNAENLSLKIDKITYMNKYENELKIFHKNIIDQKHEASELNNNMKMYLNDIIMLKKDVEIYEHSKKQLENLNNSYMHEKNEIVEKMNKLKNEKKDMDLNVKRLMEYISILQVLIHGCLYICVDMRTVCVYIS